MARPRMPRDVRELVERVWAEEPRRSAVEVWKLLQRTPYKPKKRSVQRVVHELRGRLGVGPFETDDDQPLTPWREGWPTGDPEGIALLFGMARLWALVGLPRLSRREAKWVLRLRHAAGPWHDSEDLVRIHVLARLYAFRERAGEVLKRAVSTLDLDSTLAMRPWDSPEHYAMWRAAMERKLIPGPDTWAQRYELERAVDPTLTLQEYEELVSEVQEIMTKVQEASNERASSKAGKE